MRLVILALFCALVAKQAEAFVKDTGCNNPATMHMCPPSKRYKEFWYAKTDFQKNHKHINGSGLKWQATRDPTKTMFQVGVRWHFTIQAMLDAPQNQHIFNTGAWKWAMNRMESAAGMYDSETVEMFAAIHSYVSLPTIRQRQIAQCYMASIDRATLHRDDIKKAHLVDPDWFGWNSNVTVYVPRLLKDIKQRGIFARIGGAEAWNYKSTWKSTSKDWSNCLDMMYDTWSPEDKGFGQPRPYKNFLAKFMVYQYYFAQQYIPVLRPDVPATGKVPDVTIPEEVLASGNEAKRRYGHKLDGAENWLMDIRHRGLSEYFHYWLPGKKLPSVDYKGQPMESELVEGTGPFGLKWFGMVRLNIDWSPIVMSDLKFGCSDCYSNRSSGVSNPEGWNGKLFNHAHWLYARTVLNPKCTFEKIVAKQDAGSLNGPSDCWMNGMVPFNTFEEEEPNHLTAESHSHFRLFGPAIMPVKSLGARFDNFRKNGNQDFRIAPDQDEYGDGVNPMEQIRYWPSKSYITTMPEADMVKVLDTLFGQYFCDKAGNKYENGFRSLKVYMYWEMKTQTLFSLGWHSNWLDDPGSGMFGTTCASSTTYPDIIYKHIMYGDSDGVTLGKKMGLSDVYDDLFKLQHHRWKKTVEKSMFGLGLLSRLKGGYQYIWKGGLWGIIFAWCGWCFICGQKYRFATHNWVIEDDSWKKDL